MSSTSLIGLADVEAAAARIVGTCVRTPLLCLAEADSFWVKPESLQPTGAFKLRGATNAVAVLSAQERARGVVTHSSGNHGQALAYAARRAGVACTVVMPDGSPAIKVDATRGYGADVRLVPVEQRDAECARIAADTGYAVVPPFDDARIIAGQGTVGLEIAADLPELATVLVPVGGGGLISGVAAAVKASAPRARVIGVEPELAGDAAAGFAAGERAAWSEADTGRTAAEGLRSPQVGDLNWAHIHALVDDIVTVTEEEIRDAARLLVARGRLVVEASGAVATAAQVAGRLDRRPGPVVAIVSGGNADPAWLTGLWR
ncbi:MAG: threonine ammonia-lyase [Nocardioidaceae bacterium]